MFVVYHYMFKYQCLLWPLFVDESTPLTASKFANSGTVCVVILCCCKSAQEPVEALLLRSRNKEEGGRGENDYFVC